MKSELGRLQGRDVIESDDDGSISIDMDETNYNFGRDTRRDTRSFNKQLSDKNNIKRFSVAPKRDFNPRDTFGNQELSSRGFGTVHNLPRENTGMINYGTGA